MSVPDYQALMLPVLSIASAGEVRIGDAVDQVADRLALAAEDRAALLSSGKQTLLSNRVHWAKTYLMKAGLVESTKRGHFKITSRGEQVLASQPARIDNMFLSQFDEFRQFKERSAQSAADETGEQQTATGPALVNRTETPDEIMRVAHRQIEASLAQDLLDRIYAAPPVFFERLIVNLLLNMGFGGSAADAGRAIGLSDDDGVDGDRPGCTWARPGLHSGQALQDRQQYRLGRDPGFLRQP